MSLAISYSVKQLVLVMFHVLSLEQGRLAGYMLTAKPQINCTTLNLFSESESQITSLLTKVRVFSASR
jgi:hypothetical protein